MLFEFLNDVTGYHNLQARATERLPKFAKFLHGFSENGKYKILTSIKSYESFKSKLKRKGDASKIDDVLRGAILTDTYAEAKEVANRLKKHCEEWDYKDGSGMVYHGGWHFKVYVDGMIAEIQVMEKSLWDYKEAGHPIYNRLRDGEKDPSAERFAKHLYCLGWNHTKNT
jgi:hypothetical protein